MSGVFRYFTKDAAKNLAVIAAFLFMVAVATRAALWFVLPSPIVLDQSAASSSEMFDAINALVQDLNNFSLASFLFVGFLIGRMSSRNSSIPRGAGVGLIFFLLAQVVSLAFGYMGKMEAVRMLSLSTGGQWTSLSLIDFQALFLLLSLAIIVPVMLELLKVGNGGTYPVVRSGSLFVAGLLVAFSLMGAIADPAVVSLDMKGCSEDQLRDAVEGLSSIAEIAADKPVGSALMEIAGCSMPASPLMQDTLRMDNPEAFSTEERVALTNLLGF